MFKVGDFIYSFKEGHYHVVQILQVSEDYLVKDHWDISNLNCDELEVRSWVKRVDIASCEKYEFLKNQELTAKDQEEMGRFLEIEKGLTNRKQRTASMFDLVEMAIQKQDFLHALELLTEWAMLDKYRPEIYLLREDCLRKLGRETEADYEHHVYQTLTGK